MRAHPPLPHSPGRYGPGAARYTADRRPNFDIYLPVWLARYNKHIFGPLFAAGMVFAALRWWAA